MKADEFVLQVTKSVVDENTELYRDLFTDTEDATDPYWIRALSLYKSLDAGQKEIFLEVVRHTIIDSVSTVFAIIDGVSQLEGQDGDIRMTCGDHEIAGELQDRFLVQFEE